MPLMPGISDVVANVLAQAVTSAATWALRSAYDPDMGASKEPADILSAAVRTALAPLDDVEEVDPQLGGDRLKTFFESPDLFNLVQRLFIAELRLRDDGTALEIREEFLLSWALWVSRPPEALRPHVDRLFSVIHGAVRAAAAEASASGLVADDWRGAPRTAVIVHQLSSIDRRLAFLAQPHSVDAFHKFEHQYRTQVKQRNSRITPPHIDDARRVALDKIYVEPGFVGRLGKNWTEERLSLDQVRQSLLRTVLLGQPGGGKSTFTVKLCSDLTSNYDARLVGGVALTPVLVVLRDYGVAKAEHQMSLLDFMSHTAHTDYQLSTPDGAFEYMMQQGRALVIFDGLDELVDPSRRRGIRDDIESFCERFPAVRTLVTARDIGYEQAPLDPDEFEVIGLAEFDDEQVGEYVDKWFAAHPDVSQAQRGRRASAFMRESERVVSDLRRNALLLALMCNIYKGEGYIPTNRPEVYEKCSNMLLRRWDSSRGIDVARPLGAHLERTLQHLAHWMFKNVDVQGGVPERRLLAVATDYLAAKRFEDEDEARTEAKNFLEFCKGRAWVLVEVGTAKGQALFHFAHRTFLEYFTAEYIVRNSDGPQQLGKALLPRMGRAAWDVVAQLAFQIQHSYREDAGDELLELTLDEAGRGNAPRHLVELSFAIRALDFLVPTPKVTRRIATAGIDRVLELTRENVRGRVSRRRQNGLTAEDLFADLASISDENLGTVTAAVAQCCEKWITDADDPTAVTGVYVTQLIAEGLPFRARRRDAFEDVAQKLLTEHDAVVRRLARVDMAIGANLLFRRAITVADYVDAFGAAALFGTPPEYLGALWFRSGWSEFQVFTMLNATLAPDERARLHGDLASAGERLMMCEMPWVPGAWALSRVMPVRRSEDNGETAEGWTPKSSFGAFCLLLPFMQAPYTRRAVEHNVTSKVGGATAATIGTLLRARTESEERKVVERCMEALGWDDHERTFARRWIRRRTSAIGREASPARRRRRARA
jgi:hypothetical protein